mgnify:CR=1 FL=1
MLHRFRKPHEEVHWVTSVAWKFLNKFDATYRTRTWWSFRAVWYRRPLRKVCWRAKLSLISRICKLGISSGRRTSSIVMSYIRPSGPFFWFFDIFFGYAWTRVLVSFWCLSLYGGLRWGIFFWCSKQFFNFLKDSWFALLHLTPGYINVAICLHIRCFM